MAVAAMALAAMALAAMALAAMAGARFGLHSLAGCRADPQQPAAAERPRRGRRLERREAEATRRPVRRDLQLQIFQAAAVGFQSGSQLPAANPAQTAQKHTPTVGSSAHGSTPSALSPSYCCPQRVAFKGRPSA